MIWRGWLVLFAVAWVWITLAFGASMGWAFFLPHVKSAADIGDEVVGVCWASALCLAAVIVPYTGRAVDTHGPRKVLLACFVPVMASTSCIQFISEPWHLSIIQLINRVILVGAVCCCCQKVIARWFVARGSLAACTLALSDVCLYTVPVIVDGLIEVLGWKLACVAIACIFILPAHLFFLAIVRNTPGECGTFPDGLGDRDTAKLPAGPAPLDGDGTGFGEKVWTLKQAQSTIIFWVLTLGFTSFELYMPGFSYHSVAIMASVGFGTDGVRITFLMMNASGVVGSLVTKLLLDFAYLGDSQQKRLLRALSLSLFTGALAPGLYLLILDGKALWQAALYGAFIGFMSGGQQVIINIVWGICFGVPHCGHISGFNYRINFVGTGLGPLLIGFNLKYAGNTYLVQGVLMSLLLLCAAALLIVPSPRNTCSLPMGKEEPEDVIGAGDEAIVVESSPVAEASTKPDTQGSPRPAHLIEL